MAMCIETCDCEPVLNITLICCGSGPVAMLSGYVRPWNSLCLQMDFDSLLGENGYKVFMQA